MAEIPYLHEIKGMFSSKEKDPTSELSSSLEQSISVMEKYLSLAHEHDKKLVFRQEDLKTPYGTNPMTIELTNDERVKTDFKPLFFSELQNFFAKIEKYLNKQKKNPTSIAGFVVQPVYAKMLAEVNGRTCSEIPKILQESYRKIFNYSEGL